MGCPHTHFKRGVHLFIILKDGTKFEDKFWSRESNYVKLVDYGELKISKIRSMSYRKLDPNKNKRK